MINDNEVSCPFFFANNKEPIIEFVYSYLRAQFYLCSQSHDVIEKLQDMSQTLVIQVFKVSLYTFYVVIFFSLYFLWNLLCYSCFLLLSSFVFLFDSLEVISQSIVVMMNIDQLEKSKYFMHQKKKIIFIFLKCIYLW